MNIYSFVSLIATISCLFVGLFVYLKDKNNLVNRSFGLITLTGGIWTAFPFLTSLPEDEALALVLARAIYVFAAFVPATFYYFIIALLHLENDSQEKIKLGLVLIISTIFAILSFSPGFIEGIARYQPFFTVNPGRFYDAFMAFFVVVFGYSAYKCFNAYLESSGLRRNQLKYILASSAIAYAAGVMHFLGAYFRVEPFPHDFLLIIYASVISYAIVKHRLMDITVVFRKGLAYISLLGIFFVPIYLSILVTERATFYSIPLLAAATLIFSCGLWIVLTNPRAGPNITFSLVCLSVVIWLFSSFMSYSGTNTADILFWEKTIFVGVVYIPAFFYHFCVSFLQFEEKRYSIWLNYFISTIFLLLIPTDYLIDGLYEYYWGHYVRAGVIHPVFLLYFASVSGASLLKIYQTYKQKEKDSPQESIRIKYIFWAFVIAYLASIDFVQSYGYEIYPFGFIFVSIWVLTVTYAIVRYQLLDISIILSRASLIEVSQFLLIFPLYIFALLIIRAFTGSMHYALAGVLVAILPLFSGYVGNIHNRIENLIGKAFFREKYDSYDTLKDFSKAMVNILDLKDLNRKILSTLSRVMEIEQVSLYLKDEAKKAYTMAATHGENGDHLKDIKLREDDRLPRYLRESNQMVFKEEM